MSKSFHLFTNYYKNNSSNNFVVDNDFIVYDELQLDFLDYARNHIRQNFKSFFKYYLKKGSYAELIALFHFKFLHFTKVRIQKNDTIHHFVSPYRERSRTISYPVSDDYNFFLTITYKSPFPSYSKDIFKIIAFNDYLNEMIKKGFKRMRDYIRRHYYLELKKEFYNMSIEGIEAIFGYVPTTQELNKFLNQEASRMTKETYQYFRVYETHKSNVIHCHALVKLPKFIQDMEFKTIITMIASWFETEFNGIQLDRIKQQDLSQHKNRISKTELPSDPAPTPNNGSGRLKKYILKYMNKQFSGDTLVFTQKSEFEKIYILNTSAFVLNFLSRITSYSRGTITKKYRPFTEYSSEKAETPIEGVNRECSLFEGNILEVPFDDYDLIANRLQTIFSKRMKTIRNNQSKTTDAVNLLNAYLNEEFVVYFDHELEPILHAIDWLRNHDDYYTLSYLASRKIDNDFEEVDF